VDRLDEIFGDLDEPIGSMPESFSEALSQEIYRSIGLHGVHDIKSLRADAETACERIYGELSPKELSSIVQPALNECISSTF